MIEEFFHGVVGLTREVWSVDWSVDIKKLEDMINYTRKEYEFVVHCMTSGLSWTGFAYPEDRDILKEE